MNAHQNSKIPVVFISYSWTTPEHENWVYELAERLRVGDGIDVKLDKWDLKEGHDKFAFMERMVTSPDIDKVLVICDKGYQSKANDNRGGVGTEKLLITPEVMENVEQNKVIPIVAERDENGNDYLPTFLRTRIYIDLSNTETFEDNYEQLVRLIENAPLYRKPPLGKRRTFSDQEDNIFIKTGGIVAQMRRTAESNPQKLKALATNFTDLFLEDLEQLNINFEDFDNNAPDEKIIEKLDQSLPIRDNFIEVVKILSENDKIETEWLVDFFERIFIFTEPKGSGSSYAFQSDQYKFLIQEMYVYACSVLLKQANYKTLNELLCSSYYFEYKHGTLEGKFTNLIFHLKSLELRNTRTNLNRISITSYIITQRINSKFISKHELLDTDMILFYLSFILNIHEDGRGWFPVTFIDRDYNQPIKLLTRLKSKRRAEPILELFGLSTIEELKSKISSYEHHSSYGYSSVGRSIPFIQSYIKPNEIAKSP
ncbi:SEFIR domain-containing protein [Paenibacillus polymyxa]|uniref:SEFIR domain-containing protein n=1 Tax=Paenibacillus polymyxa TaxID=1406 RepID=UPI001867F1EF|nr:TIR domain-containing protein [Paenibacillus polymyxa]MBE3649727.1 TIR domain-containing protein [Paenibacillus polymyxa]